MKNIYGVSIVIFFLIIRINSIFAQVIQPYSDTKFEITFGAAIGPETVMSLPKIDFLYKLGNKTNQGFYVGAGGSIWLIFAGFYSTNLNVGYRYKNIKLENSIAYFKYPRQNSGGTGVYSNSSFHISLNPKLGIKLKNTTLKIGPAFILKSDYDMSKKDETQLIDIMKIGKLRFNFEFLQPF